MGGNFWNKAVESISSCLPSSGFWTFQKSLVFPALFPVRTSLTCERLLMMNIFWINHVQIVGGWSVLLLSAAWWLLRPVLATRNGIAWVAGVLFVVVIFIQVCNSCWRPFDFLSLSFFVLSASWTLLVFMIKMMVQDFVLYPWRLPSLILYCLLGVVHHVLYIPMEFVSPAT